MIRWPFSRTASEALIVEPLVSSHLRPAADIHKQTFARGWTDGEIEDLVSSTTALAYVARSIDDSNRVVGFVILRMAAAEAEVLTVAVKPSWQGYGVGRMLMDKALSDAYQKRLASIYLEVDEFNKAARALYTKLGFKSVAERPDYYRLNDGRHAKAIVMRRDLEQRV